MFRTNGYFRKGAAFVHHGGAGTTASVCRAKVPSVVVAHQADQPYWGKRLSDLGVAPKHLHRRNLTAKRLAKRIQQVLETPRMTERGANAWRTDGSGRWFDGSCRAS